VSNYVARENIPWGGVLAFTRGQTITAEAAEGLKANGLESYIVGANTKEGRELKAEITGQPASDFETSSGTTTTTSRAAARSSANQEG
jgi:hypothetical protein